MFGHRAIIDGTDEPTFGLLAHGSFRRDHGLTGYRQGGYTGPVEAGFLEKVTGGSVAAYLMD